MRVDPIIGQSMEIIAEEAQRQGFQVRQTRSAMWHFRKGSDNWFFSPRNALDVLDVLAELTAVGFVWSAIERE
jgi:hypothetical protein